MIFIIFEVVALDCAAIGMICDGVSGTQLFWETEKLLCS